MCLKILQINAHAGIPADALAEEFKGAAAVISMVPGLKWKIFGLNAERSESVGLYLFEDAASLEAYLDGPIMTAMRSKPAFNEIEVKTFDVSEEATLVTRGPL